MYLLEVARGMQIVDILRSGALLVAFLSIIIGNRKDRNAVNNWLLVDTISTAGFGAGWLLFPDNLLSYMVTGKLDPIHLLVARIFGAILLTQAIVAYQKLGSNTSQNLLIKSVTLLMLVLCMCVAQSKSLQGGKQKFNNNHLTFGILGASLWCCGNLLALALVPDLGTRESRPLRLRSLPNALALVDMLFVMAAAVAYLAFPSLPLGYVTVENFKPDMVHMHMYRVVGVLLLGEALGYLAAFTTGSCEARQAMITRRLLSTVLVISLIMAYQWWYTLVASQVYIKSLAGNVAGLVALALAYYRGRALKKA